MLLVGAIIQRLARLGMEFQTRPAANCAVELYVGSVQFGLSRFQNCIETLDQAGYLVAIKMTVVVVQFVELRVLLIFRLVITALDSPHVGPMRRRRVIRAK